MSKVKEFDLNIEKVLDNWEIRHAVRELIANAFDEQILTGSSEVEISKDGTGRWHVRDYGRGLNYRHLTQNENPEKLSDKRVIGKFGVGLKDALATFDRHGVGVEIESRHGIFTIKHARKAGFDDIVTLHVGIAPAKDADFAGTDCILTDCPDEEMEGAKEFFLKFAELELYESTKYGEIYRADGMPAIYVNGIKIAEEPNFAFSYNITKPTESLRKALNRERTNVGRGAYTDRIKDILMEAKSDAVCDEMLEELKRFTSGEQKEELKWLDVQLRFIWLLDKRGNVVFVTASEYGEVSGRTREIVEDSGKEIVYIPDAAMAKLRVSDGTITDIGVVQAEYMESFEYDFVEPGDLSEAELKNYGLIGDVVEKVFPRFGGEILISEKLRTIDDGTRGVCEGLGARIIILREVLGSRSGFMGTLAHELIHAKSGASDCSRAFENALTECIGELLAGGC